MSSFKPVLLMHVCVFWTGSQIELLGQDLSDDQELILACYKQEVESVVKLLRAGASVDARFGEGDKELFRDPETGGLPMLIPYWTPLIALSVPSVSSNFVVSDHGLSAMSAESYLSIDETTPVGQRRSRRRIEILNILISHNCNTELSTPIGATALNYAAIARSDSLVRALVEYGAAVNTTPTVTVEEPSQVSVLHASAWSESLSRFLIEHGADDTAKNGYGETPKQLRERFKRARPDN